MGSHQTASTTTFKVATPSSAWQRAGLRVRRDMPWLHDVRAFRPGHPCVRPTRSRAEDGMFRGSIAMFVERSAAASRRHHPCAGSSRTSVRLAPIQYCPTTASSSANALWSSGLTT